MPVLKVSHSVPREPTPGNRVPSHLVSLGLEGHTVKGKGLVSAGRWAWV